MLFDLAPQSGLPGLELAAVMGLILQFLFAMLRMGAFLMTSPLFGARYIPLPIRIVASVILTIPVFMTVEMPSPAVLSQMSAVPMVLGEILIGGAAGLVLTIIFGAATIAGDRIASTAGLGFATQIDPAAGSQTPVVAQIFSLFMLAIFLGQDGHLESIRIMVESYRMIPPGVFMGANVLMTAGIDAAGLMFLAGFKLMMPVVSVLLLVNTVVGVITRSAPQLNIFSFGFPMTLMATVVLLFFSVPSLGAAMSDVLEDALNMLDAMIGGAANG